MRGATKNTVLVVSFVAVALCGYEVGRLRESWLIDVVTTGARVYQDQVKKTEEELGKCVNKPQKHNYSTFQQGPTRWRFDAVDGSSCVLLTTAENWKRPDIKRENCACADENQIVNEPLRLDILRSLGCYAGLESALPESKKNAK